MLKCYSMSRERTSSMLRFANRARVVLIPLPLVIAIIVGPPELRGAQVVIHFGATISQLDGDISSVPISLAVGDAITVEYSFPVADFTSNQTAGLGLQKLILGSTVLESNNSAGLALNDGLPVPPFTPRDTLSISCASLTNVFPACNTNRFPNNENLIWDPTLALYADPGSLQTLADVRALSSLSSVHGTGMLLIDIFKLDPLQASEERLLTIRATVTKLSAVPEPAAIFLAIVAIDLLVGLRIRLGNCAT